ncbi:MAG: tyrosine-protein phosphatase [Novosphingobium sp.]
MTDRLGAGAIDALIAHPDRFVQVAGAHNFRDMGGYPAADGRTVKWRTLFRSGVMSHIPASEEHRINELGIVAIFDLRTDVERHQHPTHWRKEHVDYQFRPHTQSLAEMEEMIARGDFTAENTRAIIERTYRKLPFEQASSYRRIFDLLLDGRAPMVFNCAAGKDRTGVAAALILTALGVPREVIAQDYALTEQSMDQLVDLLRADPTMAPLTRVPRHLYLPLLRADPAYLDLACAEIAQRHGSIAEYLKTEIGLGSTEINALRARLLD